MRPYVLDLREIDGSHVDVVGGKAANLGELARLDGVRVPRGYCVTTHAFAAAGDRLAEGAVEAIRKLHATFPSDMAFAVRSSATAEDLPGASFAGQLDSFLNVRGIDDLLDHVRRCRASLSSERAVRYRRHQGVGEGPVSMAVVVQEMVHADAAGVLFTADPITGHRKVATIEAVHGLGDEMVSGRAAPDRYTVRPDAVVQRTIVSGTAVLADDRVLELVDLGRRIERHFGHPQDIEWCLAGRELSVVQSRPITTLFPIPVHPDGEAHGRRVYVSVGHQQMMTDAMMPLGLSLFQKLAGRPMYTAGGRLFVDVTAELASPVSRPFLLHGLLGRHDPLVKDALLSLLEPGEVVDPPPAGPPPPIGDDATIVPRLIERARTSLEELAVAIRGRAGADLLDFVLSDVEHAKWVVRDPESTGVILAGIHAATWINDHLSLWLDEPSAADVLARSAPYNVTSEMGLALLDVADAIRPHPAVVAYLERAGDEGFLEGLVPLEGGREAKDAIGGWLDRYGMRCPGEIDITRPRWRERPTMLVPLILAHVRSYAPGERARRFEQGLRDAADKERELTERLRRLPDGEQKAAETSRMIRRLRSFAGYRELPKYSLTSRLFLYKRALALEAERLVRAGVLDAIEDIDALTIDELSDVVRTDRFDPALVARRRAEHRLHRRLAPPRVLTSEGEMLSGEYRRGDLPAGALPGLAVSSGVAEGRARVLLDLAKADLAPGDILVTRFTDPSWTPLFVGIAGLVTEVGGLMGHGAVVAREYGLPAVVGVADATRRIADGERIRIDGTEGYVQRLAW